MRRQLIFLTLVLNLTVSFAQKETNIWYFGTNAGLDFTSGSPVALTNSAMNAPEGCGTISDSNGNLLMYTTGENVWDKNHNVMPNGDSLGGAWSATQTGLIVPQPGSNTIYYIFSLGGGAGFELPQFQSGFYYSIVDMSLNGGLGDVTTKNIMLIDTAAEKLTAVKHCNGTDIWVIAHGSNSDPTGFYAFLVTSTGVSAPVISNVGLPYVSSGGFGACNALGGMKASPDGSKLAVTRWCGPPSEIFDFDISTGIVSNPVQVQMRGYGVEFSPDNTKLYFSAQIINTTAWGIYQFNLCDSDFANTYIFVGGTPYLEQTLQTGPDGKIYVAMNGEQYLGVINNPNETGTACNYVSNGVSLNGQAGSFGLPNFISSYFYGLTPLPEFTSVINSCDSSSFFAPCVSNVDSVKWIFDDPGSGAANTSALMDPKHKFSAMGDYDVQLIFYHYCLPPDTISQTITIDSSITVVISGTTTVCAGDSATLSASGGGTYLWSTGETSSSITISPDSSTTYSVAVSNGICTGDSSVTVDVISAPDAAIAGPGSVCSGGDFATLTASGGTSYLWSTGSTFASISEYVSPTTTFTVTVSNGFCTDTASHTVYEGLTIFGSDTICSGSSVLLYADIGDTYQWYENGSPIPPPQGTQSSITVNPTTTTTYSVDMDDFNGFCPSESASFTVTVVSGTTASINSANPFITSICYGDSVTLTASAGSSYLWSNSAATQSITVSPASSANFTVTVSGGGCNATATATVAVNGAAATINPSSATICSGDNIPLTASGGGTYSWSTGSAGASISVSPTSDTVFYVTVTNSGCTDSASAFIDVVSSITASISGATSLCGTTSTTLTASGGNSFAWSTGDTTASITVSPASDTVFTVTVTSGGCSDDTSVTVTVGAIVATISSSAPTVCSGDSVTLTANAADSYSWSTSEATQSITVNASGTYSLTVTSGTCSDDTSITITVTPMPVAAIAGDTSICSGDSATLTASGGASYLWDNSDTSQSIIVSPSSSAAFFVTVSNGGCSDTASIQVNVTASSAASVSGNNTICSGESTTLTASGGVNYQWNNSATTATITVSPTTTTTYSVSVTSGSCSDDTSFTVTVNQTPVAEAGANVSACSGLPVTLNASGGSSYNWSPVTGLSSSNAANPSATPGTTTTYTVVVSNGSCSDTDSVVVTVLTAPTADAGMDTTIIIGNEASLIASGGAAYLWSTGESSSGITVGPEETTEYIVTVTAANGCKDIDTITVTVDIKCGEVFVASAISPNGDGKNDMVFVRNNCLQSVQFAVYDRWGEQVFYTEDINTGWDGTHNGKQLNTAVFVYFVKAVLIDGTEFEGSGNITLFR